MPMGAPGCPEFAAWTASIDKARMALASVRRLSVGLVVSIKGRALSVRREPGGNLETVKKPGNWPCPGGHSANCGGRLRLERTVRGRARSASRFFGRALRAAL